MQTWPSRAVSAHLLPTGKVLFVSYYVESKSPQIWDPVTNAVTPAATSSYDLFCAGHSFLPDGKLLFTGGHHGDYIGWPNASIYDPFTNTLSSAPNMNAGRWYPNNTTLANGDVLVVSGDIDSQTNVDTLPQVWQSASGTWRDLSTALLALPLYPRMFLAPNGKVFEAGPNRLTRFLDTNGTGTWTTVANTKFTIARTYGSAVMYDVGKVLIVGGGGPPTNSAETIDLNNAAPAWKYTGSMAFIRRQHNATILPDGKVLITGGSGGSGFDDSTLPVFAAEMWNPATGAFTTMAANSTYRGYHSTALLLPDGRVLSAGGNVGGPNAEIYSPPYLFNGPRPTISSAPTTIGYGQQFAVNTPDAANIAQVSFIRLGSVTHSFDMNQRFMRLTFTPTATGLNVTAPADPNIAPPGHYMMFLLFANGVPSTASIIQIATSPPPVGSVAGKVTSSAGSPLVGAKVSSTAGGTVTDATGTYALPNVPAGSVAITASLSGYQSSTQTLSVVANTSTSANFTLTPASAPPPATSGTVSGQVTKISNGQALAGATVQYSGGSTLTNITGNYTFASVPAGTFNFTASANGSLSRTISSTVTAGANTATNFQLTTAGKIRGTVTSTTGAAVSGVTVKLSGGVISTTATLTTDASGNYLSNWIPVGNYTVTVSKTGHTTLSKTGTVTSGVTTVVSFSNF
ncbi:MAG: Kelch domain protein [Acidobacteriaceae bacterium]|nr:Kelch domain protein [Acidobacteriaceae bacterium]